MPGCQFDGHHERTVRLDVPSLCKHVAQVRWLRRCRDLEPGWQPMCRVGALDSRDPLSKDGLAQERLVVVAEREHGVRSFRDAAGEPELPAIDERVFKWRPRSRAEQIKLASGDAHDSNPTPEGPNEVSCWVANLTIGRPRVPVRVSLARLSRRRVRG